MFSTYKGDGRSPKRKLCFGDFVLQVGFKIYSRLLVVPCHIDLRDGGLHHRGKPLYKYWPTF